MFIVISILSIIYMISIILVLTKDKNGIRINPHNTMALSFAVVFSLLLPFVVISSYFGFNSPIFMEYIIHMTQIEWLFYYVCIFIVSHVFLAVIRKFGNNTISIEIKDNSQDKYLFYIGFLIFIIGALSDILYLNAYGGYFNYLNYSGALRSGYIIINNPFSFLIAFRKCIIFSSYIFCSLFASNRTKKNKILFIISFAWSLFVLFADKGRMSFIIYFLILIIFMLGNNEKSRYIKANTLLKIAIIGVLSLVALIYGGNILSRNGTDNIIKFFSEVFSYIFVNFKLQLENVDLSNMRFGQDLINLPLFVLPSSIWKVVFNYKTASTINTIFLYGAEKGSSTGVQGEMPIDFVSLSYMQFGIIGIIILPIVYAVFFAYCFKTIKSIKNKEVRRIISIYITLNLGVFSIVTAEPHNIIGRAFPFIVFLLVYKFFNKFKIKIR